MSKDTALKFYLVARDRSKKITTEDSDAIFVNNFIVAAYSEEEALDIHPCSYPNIKPDPNKEIHMYSKHSECFPVWSGYEWVKNPKEDAYVRLLGYVAEDALEYFQNQDVIAINCPSFASGISNNKVAFIDCSE